MSGFRNQPRRWVADVMLGRLARYLRFLGWDVAYERDASDERLRARVREEGRVLLTRDRALSARLAPSEVVVLKANDPLGQLAELRGLRLLPVPRPAPPRCMRCNGMLSPVPAELVADRVPTAVRRRGRLLRRCRECGRVYWEGTHVRRLRGRLASAGALEDEVPAGSS